MTKQEVIEAILSCVEKLGRVPTVPELVRHQGMPQWEIKKYFGNYKRALEECNLQMSPCGRRLELDRLFRDWAEVVRKLKKLPSIFEYEMCSKYSRRPLNTRFGSWTAIPGAMKLYAEEHGLAAQWPDVLALVDAQAGAHAGRQVEGPGVDSEMLTSTSTGLSRSMVNDDRPTYGPLIRASAFVYGPTNENGVLCLFGAMAEKLGFQILRIQLGFPDCEAMRVVGKDRLKPVKIEFEFESQNFLKHMHDPKGCDLIVCWEHNWRECPLEVIELRTEVEKIGKSGHRGIE